jgi:hypothetical protein
MSAAVARSVAEDAAGLLARASRRTRPRVSFEFFPPKTPEAEDKLWQVIAKLAPLAPSFVSVTYGAGGSTRDRTHRTVARIVKDTPLKPAAHLTCVGASRAEIDEVLGDYWAAGVRHIVALRGDPPGGIAEAYVPHPDGYVNAAALAEGTLACRAVCTSACSAEGVRRSAAHASATGGHRDPVAIQIRRSSDIRGASSSAAHICWDGRCSTTATAVVACGGT